mgnify:CR=1 FL=1
MNRVRTEGYWRQRVIQRILLRGMTVTQATRLHVCLGCLFIAG